MRGRFAWAFRNCIPPYQRVQNALIASRIVAKVLSDPILDQFEFWVATEKQSERGFVHVVEETLLLRPLRVPVFEGQVNDAVGLERPGESGETVSLAELHALASHTPKCRQTRP